MLARFYGPSASAPNDTSRDSRLSWIGLEAVCPKAKPIARFCSADSCNGASNRGDQFGNASTANWFGRIGALPPTGAAERLDTTGQISSDRLVQELQIGDEVQTLAGRKTIIKWIGYDKLTKEEGSAWHGNADLRGALYRDLYLSPLTPGVEGPCTFSNFQRCRRPRSDPNCLRPRPASGSDAGLTVVPVGTNPAEIAWCEAFSRHTANQHDGTGARYRQFIREATRPKLLPSGLLSFVRDRSRVIPTGLEVRRGGGIDFKSVHAFWPSGEWRVGPLDVAIMPTMGGGIYWIVRRRKKEPAGFVITTLTFVTLLGPALPGAFHFEQGASRSTRC